MIEKPLIFLLGVFFVHCLLQHTVSLPLWLTLNSADLRINGFIDNYSQNCKSHIW